MVKSFSLLKASGFLNLKLLDQFGNVIEDRDHTNLVVNTGLGYITSRMKDATTTAMTHMGVGTSTTAAAAAQTGLLAEIGTRATLDSTTVVTTTATNDSIQYVATFGQGISTGAITEAGLFNASSSGTMLCRTVFSVINKGANDSLAITWKISLAAV
jgi:hypothetical protein